MSLWEGKFIKLIACAGYNYIRKFLLLFYVKLTESLITFLIVTSSSYPQVSCSTFGNLKKWEIRLNSSWVFLRIYLIYLGFRNCFSLSSSQITFTCSNSTKKHFKKVWNMFKVNNNVTLFWCFYCSLWTKKCLLGSYYTNFLEYRTPIS